MWGLIKPDARAEELRKNILITLGLTLRTRQPPPVVEKSNKIEKCSLTCRPVLNFKGKERFRHLDFKPVTEKILPHLQII